MSRCTSVPVTTAETVLYKSSEDNKGGTDGAAAGIIYMKNTGSSRVFIRSSSLGHESKANNGGYPLEPGETSPPLVGPRSTNGAILEVTGWAESGTSTINTFVTMGVGA